jgi:hypothetical protein
MIKITVVPKSDEKLFNLLVQKEKEIRHKATTFYRKKSRKKSGEEKWSHTSNWGWIHFQRCFGEILVVVVNPKKEEDEWHLVNAFVGYLHRHFNDKISSIQLNYNISE